MGTGEIQRWFWRGDLREIFVLESLGVDGKIILKRGAKKYHGDMD